MSATKASILWWGRFDPGYSRNRILRRLLAELGFAIEDFRPRVSALGALEASLRRAPAPALVWVPCFRQRDLAAARRWSAARAVPLVADPLISAFDKQVNERGRFAPTSRRGRRLRHWEASRLAAADCVLADTEAHARYFRETLGLDADKVQVVQLGAEEVLFRPAPLPPAGAALEVLFFGSFIGLQAPEVIVAAARRYRGPPARWTLLGDGPLREVCETAAAGCDAIRFEPPVAYDQLPARIARAELLLGVFGASGKAGRVVPNKVVQALASGRVVVTRSGDAYPPELLADDSQGLVWVPPEDPDALAAAVARLAGDREGLAAGAARAAETYRRWFGLERVRAELGAALASVGLTPARG